MREKIISLNSDNVESISIGDNTNNLDKYCGFESHYVGDNEVEFKFANNSGNGVNATYYILFVIFQKWIETLSTPKPIEKKDIVKDITFKTKRNSDNLKWKHIFRCAFPAEFDNNGDSFTIILKYDVKECYIDDDSEKCN